jgi:hypothetical protein
MPENKPRAAVFTLVVGIGSALQWLSASVSAGTATVNLPVAAITSAGVFDAQDRLVRTLWSNRESQPGPLRVDWDGRDDAGMPVAVDGHYRARVLTHHVKYLWEGVIGNTSTNSTGPDIHRALHPISDMAIDAAGHAFYVVGYDEQLPGIHRFDVTRPQQQTSLSHDDYRRAFRYVATDGKLAYFANIGLPAPKGAFNREPSTFVMALNVSDGSAYSFPQGQADVPPGQPLNRWDGVIDDDRDDVDVDGALRSAPSGLAVQVGGSALFVAHRNLDAIRVFDKRSGAMLTHIGVSRPIALAVAADDSLWVLCSVANRPAVVHYRLESGRWREVDSIVDGLQQPVAIAVSPVDATLVIADAGSEQLKAFDAHGHPSWSYGRLNGYRDGGPDVTADRLWLSDGPTYIAFQRDGSFWFGDPGNDRNIHLSPRRDYREEIMYLPMSYRVAVDSADPRRIFNRFLEFSVDYSKSLAKSWKLTKNWAAGIDHVYLGNLDGLRRVVTLPNHRSFGVLSRSDASGSEVVELSAQGLKPTGVRLDVGTDLYPDGSLRNQVQRQQSVEVYKRDLAGFDAAGHPRWGEPKRLAGIASLKSSDPYYHDVPLVAGVNEAKFPETEHGVVVFFNPGTSMGFHLGGVRIGEQQWLWRASPSGTWRLDANGMIVTPDGSYEVQHGVQYLGNVALTAGANIVYGYHGEAWNGGQANQWLHFLDNGLFVGQFGIPVYPAQNRNFAHAGSAGNAFSAQLVTVDDKLYLWHNDESVHGGVHRWRIDGANDLKILEADIGP